MRPQVGGHVILVYSPKGGVGTTTIAVNLAISLQGPQSRTVIVDGNLQYGDVGVYVNETGYHSILDLTSRIDDLDPDVISSVIVNHAASGVDVMIAPNRPEMAEKVSGEDFFKVIQYLRRHYAYVIIDTPSELGEITLSSFDAADLLVLVTTQEIPAIKNTRLFLTVADSLHIPRQQIVFVVNRFDRQIAISPERIGDNLKLEVAEVIAMDLKGAIRAENQGQPFVLEKKIEPIGRSVVHLAETIRQRIAAQVNTEPAAGKNGTKAA
ncbi:MAG TPA: AAA family ATPase [Anaerolineaceae bacterium]|nr:AAA family ATPase [Anaerolineaceae bacterium]